MWAVAWLAVGCAPEAKLSDPLSYEAVEELPSASHEEGSFRGPGKWYPNLEASARPVDISLITSGLMRGITTRANGSGDHVTFALDGNACAVDATTGNMDTDTPVEGGNIEVNDGEPTGNALVVTTTGVYEVEPGQGGWREGQVDAVVRGSFLAARYVGDEVFAVTSGCEVLLPEASQVAMPGQVCDQLELASTDSGLAFASPKGTLLVHAQGAVVIDQLPSQHIAAVGSSVFVTEETRVRALSESWQHELGAGVEILDLHAADDLDLVLVEVNTEEQREARVLDAQTGEWLGTFALTDRTEGLDVSAQGGLLVQIRPDDAVSWRISR